MGLSPICLPQFNCTLFSFIKILICSHPKNTFQFAYRQGPACFFRKVISRVPQRTKKIFVSLSVPRNALAPGVLQVLFYRLRIYIPLTHARP